MSKKCANCEYSRKCIQVRMVNGGERNTTGYICCHKGARELQRNQFKGKNRPRSCPLKIKEAKE